jgi:hypothetical protein
MLLTVELAAPVRRPHSDGTGYDVRNAYNGHHLHLEIGNVSIAFDDRDVWLCPADGSHDRPVLQFGEYTDDPVRLDGTSCPRCKDTAETLLFALAADLGYTLSK